MADVNELYREAEELKDTGDYDGAIAKLGELLEAHETFALAHSALAVLYGKVDQHEQAVEHAERVCVLQPNDPFSFTALSVTYQRAFAGTQDHQYIQLAEDAMARSQTMSRQAG